MGVAFLISGILAILLYSRLKRLGLSPMYALLIAGLVLIAPLWLPILGLAIIIWLVATRMGSYRSNKPVSTIMCPRCGFEVSKSVRHCSQCGNVMTVG